MRRVEPKVFLVASTTAAPRRSPSSWQIARERWPNLFSDFKREEVKGIGEWTSENWKI